MINPFLDNVLLIVLVTPFGIFNSESMNNKMQEIPGVVATETLISLEQSIKKEIPIRVEK